MLKTELREIYKKKRDGLSADEIGEVSLNIENTLLELLNELSFNSVNCFLSSSSKKEVQTKPIIEKLLTQGKSISVPLSNYKNYSIQAVQFNKDDELTEDQHGIPVPKNLDVVNSGSIDVVVVPLLCFDKNGYRCGYGKGMYDRFLSTCKKDVITIGLSFFPAAPIISDINEFDIPLNYVIHNKEVMLLK